MFAGRHVHFDQPFNRQVTTIRCLILTDVTRYIGELESKAQVTGTVECRFIGGIYAHQDGHHATDRASDMIAVAQHVILAARPPVPRIECEPFQKIMRIAWRDRTFPHDDTEAVEGGIAGPLSAQGGVGQNPHLRQARLPVADPPQRPPMVLPIGDVVALAAPGIKQPGAFARYRIK